MVMVSLEDTELSCVTGLPEWEDRETSDGVRVSFCPLLHKYANLQTVPALSVNSCPALQLHAAASTVPSSGVFIFVGDPGRHVETVSSAVEAWQLQCF